MNNALVDTILHLADSTLILSQRNAEWCGHGPVLEQDIAITNISLDLLGQARNFYQYAASLTGKEIDEDKLAYLRTEREFKNCLLVELPNGDWAQTTLRLYLFTQFQYLYYGVLKQCKDEHLAAIAEKSLKETAYHLRWSREWVIRLGDGTEESKKRMQDAITALWQYTGELLLPATYEKKAVQMEVAPDITLLQESWNTFVQQVMEVAGLNIPQNIFMQKGGKEGIHTEHMGFMLAELQYVQRAYPNSKW